MEDIPRLRHSSYASLETLARERTLKRFMVLLVTLAASPLIVFRLTPVVFDDARQMLVASGSMVRPISLAQFLDGDFRRRLIAPDPALGELTAAYLDWIGVLMAATIVFGSLALLYAAKRYDHRWTDRPNMKAALLFALPVASIGAPLFLRETLQDMKVIDYGTVQFSAAWVFLMMLIGLFGCAGVLWAAPYLRRGSRFHIDKYK